MRRCAQLFFVMMSCILMSGRGLMLKFGNAHFSTTVCPFSFIFGMIMLLASVHMLIV